MGCNVSWMIEGHVIEHKYIDTLIADDMVDVSRISLELLSSVESTIHVIADLTDLTGMQPDLMNIGNLTKLSRAFMSHENLGSIILYGTDNRMIKFLTSILFQMSKKEWRVVDNQEAALAILKRIDPSLTRGCLKSIIK